MLELFERALAALEGGRRVALVTVLQGSRGSSVHRGARALVMDGGEGFGELLELLPESRSLGEESLRTGKPCSAVVDGEIRIFAQPVQGSPHMLILGGGHIAVPLACFAARTGFEVTVVDDRPSFANRDRFPEAHRVICEPFDRALASLRVGPGDHVVIVTRGHTYDYTCLKAVLPKQPRYVGMIGSRRRVSLVLAQLRQEGFEESLIQRVHSPIGLDIGAETPAEIAVSIMAEIVAVRRKGEAGPFSLSRR